MFSNKKKAAQHINIKNFKKIEDFSAPFDSALNLDEVVNRYKVLAPHYERLAITM